MSVHQVSDWEESEYKSGGCGGEGVGWRRSQNAKEKPWTHMDQPRSVLMGKATTQDNQDDCTPVTYNILSTV